MSANHLQPFDVVKATGAEAVQARDVVAVEEPLEIRLHGSPFVVIMRTPGSDRELAAGFLLAEHVIRSADDLGVIEYCNEDHGVERSSPNILNVTLANEAQRALERTLAERRLVTSNSSCGVCGRRSIGDLMERVHPVASDMVVSQATVLALPDRLRATQRIFNETGGLHAAALFDRAGELRSAAEDVGRHNAVDKVIGREVLMDGLPLSDRLLFVSGRTSFEIVQKAIVARIPIVAAVSAPSSLAIGLAQAAGITLIGFVRGDTFNIYTSTSRIDVS